MGRKREWTRVFNQSDLANRLGCSHAAIKKWLNEHRYVEKRPTKEPNGAYLVERYKPWMEYHGLSGKEGLTDSEPSKSQELRDELMKIKIDQERSKLEKIRGSQIERDLVSEVYGKCVATIFRELDRVFGDEIPPRTRGLTEKQISGLNRRELRSVFQQAKESFSNGMVD
jgi:hypothetical protein